jgi:endonuclease/exonuclease/phosphatase family metal-dependent hydrolase
MWAKLLLGALFATSLLTAFVFVPQTRLSSASYTSNAASDAVSGQDGRRLRLMSWNIGNGDLESETRAHNEDLPAVAKLIKDNDADAVALQELTGENQLKLLLAHLENRYRGYVCSSGEADRVDAVLVKNRNETPVRTRRGVDDDRHMRFSDVPAGKRFAAAATVHLPNLPEVVLISAHADAFNASRRRTFVAEVVDLARSQSGKGIVFIAGDFNFEVSVRNKTNLFTDDAKHDSESYAYLLKYFQDLGRDAGETSINDRRIDYIFGPAGNASLRRAEVLRGAALGRMDHWPLLVEVALTG